MFVDIFQIDNIHIIAVACALFGRKCISLKIMNGQCFIVALENV